MNELHIKIIEVFARLNQYRKDLDTSYQELLFVLGSDQDAMDKRGKSNNVRRGVESIKNETSKFFDCIDGMRHVLEDEMDTITKTMRRLNRAETSVKRLRRLSDRIKDVKSTTSGKDLKEIEKEIDNIKNYMGKYLNVVDAE